MGLGLGLLFILASGVASCATSQTTGPGSAPRRPVAGSSRLVAPRTSSAQDDLYLADVAKADPTLASYVEQQGDVALRALLTDGSAFCAFLRRGGGLDNAMLEVAIGARSVEPETHLPSTVTTFNAIDAVALLTICPSEQDQLPASVKSKVRKLGGSLSN